jgi:hypothetical protein
MVANTAFLLGLTLALAPDAPTLVRRFAFQQAHHNFYRAAQFGLGAELAWPPDRDGRTRSLPATELVRELLPAARQGLVDAGWTPRRRERCWPWSRPGPGPARPAPPGSAGPWLPWSLASAAARPSPPCSSVTSITSTPATRSTPGPFPNPAGDRQLRAPDAGWEARVLM